MDFRKSLIFLLFSLIAMAGCGGGSGPGDNKYPFDIDAFEITYTDGTPNVDIEDDNRDNPIGNFLEIILLHDTTKPETVGISSEFTIHAKVIDYQNKSPAVNVPILYEITEKKDLEGFKTDGDASLESEIIYTDENGLVHNIFKSGSIPDVEYTIKLSTANAESKTIRIFVSDMPRGNISVCIDYPEESTIPPSSISNIKVSLFVGDYSCPQLKPEGPNPTTLFDKTITDVYGCTTFENIPANMHYTVFSTAKGGGACLAASGCRDGVIVLPDKTTEINLALYVLTLNPTGNYDCIDNFDFTNVVKDCAQDQGNLAQQVCGVIAEVIVFFQTPGDTIIKLIKELAKQAFPSILVDAVFGLFGDVVADIVTDWLKNNSPQWMQDFFKIGEDMIGIITNLELLSDMKLSKLNNDFTIQGTHFWKGMNLYWKIGCNPQDPNYEECGKITFSMDDLKDTKFPIDLLEGKFTAGIADFSKLILYLHKINLNYGKLILFVLNEIVIAGITNGQAHSILEAAYLWINCKSIAEGIIGEIAGIIGLSEKDVESTCKWTIDLLLGPLDAFIGSLTLDTELSLQGSGTMVDKDCDLKVDEFINGTYFGFIQTSESQQSSFTGKWKATKK